METKNIQSLVDSVLSGIDESTSEDPSCITKLEKAIDERRQLNVYGVLVPGKRAYVNCSIINFRDQYYRQFHMTSLIGYLFRTSDEYFTDPDCEISVPANINLSLPEYKKIVQDEVKTFLRRNFEFNPDIHVQSAYKENLDDPERAGKFNEYKKKMSTESSEPPPKTTKISKDDADDRLYELFNSATRATAIMKRIRKTLGDFVDDNPMFDPDFLEALSEVAATSKNKILNDHLDKFLSKYDVPQDLVNNSQILYQPAQVTLDMQDLATMLAKDSKELHDLANSIYPHICKGRVLGAFEWVPSINLYHQFDRYMCNNYELLREATSAIYATKPDIEYAIQFYEAFDTDEEAKAHRVKNEAKFSAHILTIPNEGWCLLGPYKQNRDRVDFYNKNTKIIEKMMEQQTQDTKLAESLVKQTISKKKKKNIKDMGPDAAGLSSYKKALGIIEDLGAKPALTEDERRALEVAVREKEMAEVPNDAIQVEVYKTDADGNFQRDIMYTEAAAPDFLVEDALKQKHAVEIMKNGVTKQAAYEQIAADDKKRHQIAEQARQCAEPKSNVKKIIVDRHNNKMDVSQINK